MKEKVKQIYYVCNVCNAKRYLNLSPSYHLRKQIAGLTHYNDFHSCKGELQPVIISVDANYDVRGQKRGNSIASGSSMIPSPKATIEEFSINFDDDIANVFEYVEITNLITTQLFRGGKITENLEIMESSTKLFVLKYKIRDDRTDFTENVQQRLLDMLMALEIGRNVNQETINSLILFISEHYDIMTDYVDKQIMIELTSASTVWMSWQNENSGKYLSRHGHNLLGPGGMQIAEGVMKQLEEGVKSLEEASTESGIELSSVVSIAFMLEIFGLLKYEFRDQSPIQS